MLKQFKYAARLGLYERLFTLILTVVLNFAFGLLTPVSDGWKAAAITFSGLNLCAVFIVCVISDAKTIRNAYSPFTLLTPVKRWKVLFSRIIIMMVYDLLMMIIGLAGLVYQVTEVKVDVINPSLGDTVVLVVLGVGYMFIMSVILFTVAVEKSFFQRSKFGFIPRFIVVAAAYYAASLADFVLALYAPIERSGIFFTVSIYSDMTGLTRQTAGLYALYFLKAAAFFFAAAKITERRVNI